MTHKEYLTKIEDQLNQSLGEELKKYIPEILQRVEKEEGSVVFFAMSVPDYELMAYNMQELKRYIKELKEVVVYYRKVTTNEEEAKNE